GVGGTEVVEDEEPGAQDAVDPFAVGADGGVEVAVGDRGGLAQLAAGGLPEGDRGKRGVRLVGLPRADRASDQERLRRPIDDVGDPGGDGRVGDLGVPVAGRDVARQDGFDLLGAVLDDVHRVHRCGFVLRFDHWVVPFLVHPVEMASGVETARLSARLVQPEWSWPDTSRQSGGRLWSPSMAIRRVFAVTLLRCWTSRSMPAAICSSVYSPVLTAVWTTPRTEWNGESLTRSV